MKHLSAAILLGLILTAVAAPAALGNIGMELNLNRTVYMQYEPVFACITISNETGRPLLFGEDPKLQGFILFEIRNSKGELVAKRPGADISVTHLLLQPGQIRTLVIPINRYYNIDPTDVYRVHAFVSHSMLPHEYRTKDVRFDVEPGVTIWKQQVGLPELDSDAKLSEKIRERTYELRSVTENSEKYYYLIVQDAKHVYAVARVGKQVGREKFSADVDMLSRVHLLIPMSPTVFHYLAFTPDGMTLYDEYRKTSGTIPSLIRNPDTGSVKLMGGNEARPGLDYTDPRAGMMTVADLSEAEEKSTPRFKPQPPAATGKVDLGADL